MSEKEVEIFEEFDGCRIPEFARNAEIRRMQQKKIEEKKAKEQKRWMIATIVVSLACLAMNCCLFYSIKVLAESIIKAM